MVSEEFPNIYHYFGLEQGASQEAITREYSRLVRLYHSPKNGEKPKKPQEIKTFTRVRCLPFSYLLLPPLPFPSLVALPAGLRRGLFWVEHLEHARPSP